ncbi:ankyrin repeat domain-containing protein [Achromobacter sp. ACM05]|uniref:ankyrin repeat domain-containing protein n=1 Tax=Achromobacter sp. ACM05 TaxID=2854776 RepID=UPI001C4545F0|nr:ankyrin repeat domain-containing protein [Achromobacter sp. ACM05]MBV7500044.1 ankyrin repeat domain-containing protein [Achromobacter sp. ACM05]
MPRRFRPAVTRLFGAVALALAGMAASPPPALAFDVGAVIDSIRLSRYPLREPERRVWGTENVKDAVLVGQMENRLYLYRYVREGAKTFKLDFRSQPLVIDPEGWKASREDNVAVRSPRAGEAFYWVGYADRGAGAGKATGFLVDDKGEAASVNADSQLAVVTSSRPWDEARRAQALATLQAALRDYPTRLDPFPAQVRFEHQTAPDVTATFRTLHQVARAIPRAKTAEFNRALADLRRFVMAQDYREIDPDGKDAEMLTALNDYGFWLAESGDTAQAERILTDVLRRDPSRTAAYLNRADARWKQREKSREERAYYEALAREDYRLYCAKRLAAKEAIPANIASRIGAALEASALDAQVCRPRLAIFQAIQANDLDAVRAQLAGGQDPNGVNEYGRSALSVAVSRKQLEMVRVLLDAGAKADGPDNGFSLVASALPDAKDTRPAAERYALADILIAAGAPVDALDSNGTPLLMRRISYYSDSKENLVYLLEKGANPNAREKNGRSLLHAALQTPKNFWFAEKLLARGADINAAYTRMYYGNSPMWETPLLEALRESPGGDLTPSATYAVPERVTYVLAHGADPAVGGYGASKDAPDRNGMNEGLSLAVRYLQPGLIDQLVQAARPPQAPLSTEPLSSLLSMWNQVEQRAAADGNSAAWDGQRARLRAIADRLVAAGVPLAAPADTAGPLRNRIAPLSLPWLPDDLYEAWLKAGADPTDRSDSDMRLEGVAAADALPLVTMLNLGMDNKVQLLLEHGGAPKTPARCGMAVADVLAWQLGNNGPVSPMGGRGVKQVLDAAAGPAGCDLNQTSRVQPFEGVTASELARRAEVDLPAPPR